MSIRSIVILVVFLSLGMPVHAAGQPSPSRSVGGTFLVIGDSLGTGFQSSTQPGDTKCSNADVNPTGGAGFACYVWTKLQTVNPSIQLMNLAVNGATAAAVAQGEQLSTALPYIRAHPEEVSPILVEIGGNDLGNLGSTPFGDQISQQMLDAQKAEAPAILQQAEANYDAVITQIRAAAPHADLLLPGYQDFHTGIPASLYGPLGDQLEAFSLQISNQFDSFVKAEAGKFNAIYVDWLTPWLHIGGGLEHVGPGGFTGGDYGHPTTAGYKLLGDIVWQDYLAALHGTQAVNGSMQLSQPGTLAFGAAQTIAVSTVPGAEVHVTLSYTGGQWSANGTADASGAYSTTWTANHAGAIGVNVCLTEGASQLCLPTQFPVSPAPKKKIKCKKGYKRVKGHCKKKHGP